MCRKGPNKLHHCFFGGVVLLAYLYALAVVFARSLTGDPYSGVAVIGALLIFWGLEMRARRWNTFGLTREEVEFVPALVKVATKASWLLLLFPPEPGSFVLELRSFSRYKVVGVRPSEGLMFVRPMGDDERELGETEIVRIGDFFQFDHLKHAILLLEKK